MAASAAHAAPSQPQTIPAPAVRLDPLASEIPLTGRVAVLADPAGTLDIEAVRTSEVQARLQVPVHDIRIGAHAPPHWFKIRLQRAGRENDA